MKDPFRRSRPLIGKRGAVLCVLLWLPCLTRSQNGEFPPSQTNTKTTTSKMQATFSAQALAHVINPEVPKLVSHTIADAQKIVDQQFSVVVAGYRPSTGPPGIVLSQVPDAGTREKQGTEIEVWLSEPISTRTPPPLVRVPRLIDHTRESAILILDKAPLPQGVITARESEQTDGIVLSQDPNPDSMVPPNTLVNFVVSQKIQRTLTLIAPSGGKPGETLTFVAHLDPYFPSTEYQFTFGDGQVSPWDSNPESTHPYSSDGNYDAKASARWYGGQAESHPVTVTVHSVTYTLTITPSTTQATERDEIDFRAELDPPVENAVYTFDFGDHKSASSTVPTARHAYTSSGAYAAHVSALTPDHHHKLLSFPVRVMVAAKPPSPIKAIGEWLNQFKWWIIGGALLLVGSFLLGALRSGSRLLQRPKSRNQPKPNVELKPSISLGKLTIKVQGRLWARIESLRAKTRRDHTS